MGRIVLTCVVILALASRDTAWAGNTGKITGEVKDAQTGEPVIGVNVLIEGTTQGAATNLDGYYVILNISPGTYTLSASGVGYNKKTVQNVSVSIDLTTTIDFQMISTVVDVGEEITVTAQRPLVQKDMTAKTAIVGSEQISALPVTEVGQVLSLQAGFTGLGNLRGGRSGEVAYWIDGVPVTDAYDGSQVVEVNKNLVQELQLISGAFNAEYGQAMSGIVNIATKEGGSKFAGTIGGYIGSYIPSISGIDTAAFPGLSDFRPTAIRNIEASLSGPVLGEDLTFFANGRYYYGDGWMFGFRRFNPGNITFVDSTGTFRLFRDAAGRGDSARVPMNSSERKYAQGKLTWKISPVMKLTGNFIYDNTKSRPYGAFRKELRDYYFNPDGFGYDYNTSKTLIFQLSHTLSSNTFYTLGASLFKKEYKYYLYEDPFDTRYVNPRLLVRVTPWSFWTGGTDMGRTERSTQTILAKLDVNSQVNEQNLVKVGVEFRRHRAFYEHINLQPVLGQTEINLATDSPFINTRIPDISSFDHDMYTHVPQEFSAYIQDKLEFKSIIVNVGVRFDYFQPDGNVLVDPTDPNIYAPIKPANRFFDYNGNGMQDAGEPNKTVNDRMAYWYRRASSKSQVSPRLGVSFPITARGIVHFSYGHFFQIPRFERLYENPDFKIGPGSIGVVGNADLEPEETINGEIGIQQQLTDDISADLTAYLRDIRGLTGTFGQQIIVFGGSAQYFKYTNSDFGFVKGIVLTVNKRFSGGFDATLDYTFQVARGSSSDPQEARNAINGGAQPEIQLNPLTWDQRNTLNVTMSYSATTWGLSTIVQYGSGQPFTPRRTTDITALLTNSQTKPSFFNVDLRGFYEFNFDPFRIVAFARVFNLFDIRNETDVYDDTGQAGFTLDETQARQVNPYQGINTLDQWFHIPTQYSEPRRIEFGLNVEF